MGRVMDDFSTKVCTFFILIAFWGLLKIMKYEGFFYWSLVFGLAPASPIYFQSKLALRFIFGIAGATFSHYSFDNEQELQRQRAIQDTQFVQFPPLWLCFYAPPFVPCSVLHWIFNSCPKALGVCRGEMKFLTSLLTGGAKRFHELPWDINWANLSTCELIHIASVDPCSISICLQLCGVWRRVCVYVCV